ncbi:[SSU ribosomal protein S18P]-alanine acetyltransferase [Melghiribacillus thermohalophilus]|uniref:[Ribosomal protein bS18]-alanine N-acetyltransferase n=1 Tax=Melghiribacillus thermohalophilus TaxID=1324956 RepID=A0A4R3MUG1_9BACI|nr:ribosomal protein S18-alanine N-acetyltransferase [Melghiribacillus thermohalophilus]TCT18951.1 [SSU ribosomal protein S18P]-alanine acetyltransferase [Melghiribacillus thermohalophilus]
MSEPVIRSMTIHDLDEVMNIEHTCFSSPWDRSAFVNELVENPYAFYYVIENQDRIFGYCGLWIVLDQAQITNIAILPEFRGYKFGETLFSFALQKAREKEAKSLSLEVRISNAVAQRMYRKFGMKPVGIRKNYYQDNQEDAMVMWVKL